MKEIEQLKLNTDRSEIATHMLIPGTLALDNTAAQLADTCAIFLG